MEPLLLLVMMRNLTLCVKERLGVTLSWYYSGVKPDSSMIY